MISIVTISFNQAAFLERCIRSVIDQNYPDLEYIIVDPGSTDGSRDIIERYRNRFARVVFDGDNGPADGLNRGFALATGEVCAYLNSDDALLPGSLMRVAAAFAAHPAADVIHGHGYFVDADDGVLRRFRSDRFDLRRYAFGGVVLMQQATFFRRDAFVEAGGFNTENRTCWDAELWVDFGLAGKTFVRINEDLAQFRIHAQSISGSGRLERQYRNDIDRIFGKVMKRGPRSSDALLRLVARLQKWLGDPAFAAIRTAELLTPLRRSPVPYRGESG